MCVDMCVDMCADKCVDMCVDMCADTRVDMCVYMCVDMCVYMCVYMSVYIGFGLPVARARETVDSDLYFRLSVAPAQTLAALALRVRLACQTSLC